MLDTNPAKKGETKTRNAESYITQIELLLKENNKIALLAPPGFEKSPDLKNFASSKKSTYIDLRKLSLSPENFAVDFIGSLASTETHKCEIASDN